jgi:hypothetical protein
MKKIFFVVYFSISLFGLWAQQFSIPTGSVLLESTELKNNGIPYIIERRYRIPSGEILYVYYDVEGSNSVTMQKIEQAPILSIGTDVNIPGLPGYREFNFGDDRRKLVQFMKLFKLGYKYGSDINTTTTPSLSDSMFDLKGNSKKEEFILLLDLYDESWTYEHRYINAAGGWSRWYGCNIIHVNRYSDE